MGVAHQDRGEWEEVLECFLKAIVAWEKILGAEHFLALNRRAMAAEALKRLGQLAEAAAVEGGCEITVNEGVAEILLP
jgi:hypothetical protein